jgi:hypothetical protein
MNTSVGSPTSSPISSQVFARSAVKSPYASGFAYNDSYWTDEYKIKKITIEINREIEFCEDRKNNRLFAENGFSDNDFDELIILMKRKQEYLLNNLHNDNSWEWSANIHYIVSGTKE